MNAPRRIRGVLVPLALLAQGAAGSSMAGCQNTATSSPPQIGPAPPPMGYAGYRPPGYGPPYAGLPPPAYEAPAPASPAPVAARPLLGALVGTAAWQAESRAVARELVQNLRPDYQSRVATVPIVFDPNPNDVNAFAACDDGGAPFVAATEGLLEAIDAIAQTKASDELFGTQTYDAYANFAAPRLVAPSGGSALLPAGLIAPAYWADPRRISRAHEIFDEIVAFTFGHELSHHYLGHTGCAIGANGIGPAVALLGQLLTTAVHAFNQPNEIAADSSGCVNTLDTGRARSSVAYRWTEEGGLWLLDFFGRLDRASGGNPFVSFLLTHPNPILRVPIVQAVAAAWRLQHAASP